MSFPSVLVCYRRLNWFVLVILIEDKMRKSPKQFDYVRNMHNKKDKSKQTTIIKEKMEERLKKIWLEVIVNDFKDM